MRLMLVAAMLVGACGEDLCGDQGTTYKNDVVWCDDYEGDAMCVADRGPGGPVMCRVLCSTGSEWCNEDYPDMNLWSRTMLVRKEDGSFGSICYCEPPPLAEDRDYVGR
jgi:hypothetical protein